MKRLFKYMAAAIVAVSTLAVGCTADYIEPDAGKAPSAENFDVTIVADQSTNYVTFTLNNKGMVPMFIFGDQAVDGKANKTYAYTGNGLSLRFRDAGTYSVEVKAYNAHGVSVGSKVYEFTLENTYRDPFDASPYMKALANTWQWDKETNGHFGCGSINAETGKATTDGTDWWCCGPNGKDGVGLYDDTLTFTEAGEYTYNPGDDGVVYVNWGMAAGGNYPGNYADDEQDYQAPIEAFTCAYSIENNWNEAGIEEIYLVLEPGHNLSYIPHQTAIDNPRYRFLETNVGSIRKTLSLVNEEPTENGGGGIAWKYQFVPFVHVAGPEELLAGTDAAGKVWVMDNMTPGHIACGPTAEDPTSWWSAGANEKENFGMYDNELTFCPDGTFKFNPGPDGNIYVHNSIKPGGVLPGAIDQTDDYVLAWEAQEGKYTFDGQTLTLPEGFTLGYIAFADLYTNPTFTVTEITEYTLKVVAYTATGNNGGAIGWQMIFKARDVKAPAVTFDGQDVASGFAELTIAKDQIIPVTGVNFEEAWIDPDFFEVVDASNLKFLAVDGDYRVSWDGKWFKVVPMSNGEKATYDNGKALWIIGDGGGKPTVDNLIGWNTGEAPLPCAKIGENTYRITLAMKAEGGSVKVFGQADWGVEWKKENYGTVTDNGFFHIPGDDGNIHTIEGTEPGYYTFFFTDNDGILDMEVKKAKFGDQTIYDPAYEGNMWLNCNILEMTYYYAPGWAQIDNPGFEENGTNDYTITLPVATTDQWQAQVAFKTDMTTSADKNYDFYVVLNSTMDHPGVTIKLVLDGDDNTFYFADRHALTAYEDFVYKVPNMTGIDMSKINLFFDFGGCAENTVVNIKDILLQEHREAE